MKEAVDALNHAVTVADKLLTKSLAIKSKAEAVARSVGTPRENREVTELKTMLDDLELFL